MFGKVKKILGIEGVKMEIIMDHVINLQSEAVTGIIKLTTKTDSDIESIDVKLIEKYSRGRNENRLIDEYVLGKIILNEKQSIASDEIIEVPFHLDFVHAKSEMDKAASDNFFLKAPIKIAKWIKKVSSTYRIEAHAHVKGTKLQPFAELKLKVK